MTGLDVRVRSRREEAQAICSFELEPVEPGVTLPTFSPGAHIDVQLASGPVRQYSLCGDPADRRTWRIGVLREADSRGGSAGLHERAVPGTVLRVSAPRNLFALGEAPHSLLFAGGIGITPILAMARALQRDGRSFELHYAARAAARMAFREEIAGGPLGPQARFYFSEDAASERLDVADVLARAPAGTHLYVCGPVGFMDHVLATARAAGWAEARLHREYFAAPVAATPEAGDAAFSVRLVKSGATLAVPAEARVLDVLLAHGIDVPFSCEAGVCGSCMTRVLAGEPDHRDSFLTAKERAANDRFTPCCSRARTPLLVLDL